MKIISNNNNGFI